MINYALILELTLEMHVLPMVKTTWFTESVIIMQNNESLGRDDTWFRVNRPTINDLRIEYTVEASRDKVNWIPQSHVTINRISGEAIDWAIYEHGGTSYQCHLEGKRYDALSLN